jgi:para-nitrobenzyl esterase
MEHGLIATTRQGAVRGTIIDGVVRYLGIPYAAAPFGENRFALPQPHAPWDGVREALSYGPTPPQLPYGGGLEKVLPTKHIPGEEILNLNIWSPAKRLPRGGHPVMVWICGGGLAHGSNALETYDGSAFARDGVILVAPNYRVGAEGFSVLDDAPTNLGIADQLAALRWVRENIAAFGGDPSQVTVFGQSAGGGSTATLLAHPDAPSLISKAIIMSGPLEAWPREKGRRVTELMARDLGIEPTRAAFCATSPADLLASQKRVTAGSSPITGGVGFGIVVGDDLVPADPGEALSNGVAASIPLMLGYTSEEYRLWFVPSGVVEKITWLHLLIARFTLGIPGKAIRTFRRNRKGAKAGVVFGDLATDMLLRVPKNRLADARAGRTWMYEFAWRTPVLDLGAAHALDLGFVFDTLDTTEADAFAGPERPRALADEMHAAWVRFAKTGEPGWAEWDESRPVMTFDFPTSAVVHAPRDDERASLG